MAAAPLLAVADLTLSFATREGRIHALDRVGFDIAEGEMVGLVGESGSGKSVTAYAIADLLDPTARIGAGAVRFRGVDLLGEGRRHMAELRGTALAMIFQNPAAALNPIRPVGQQIADAIRAHRRTSAADAAAEALRMLAAVKIPDPQRRAQAYPFELSGGTCQRVMIAIALACAPRLLIADEPTTGLDVTTQASIMDLLRGLARERGMATLFITHDLSLAGDYCDRIVVMHAGQVVESAPTRDLLRAPLHPYTRKLIAATPRRDSAVDSLAVVPGSLPDLGRPDLPPCRYAGRCEFHESRCDGGPPPLVRPDATRSVACWRVP